MANVVREPSRELKRLASRIESGCGYYLKARAASTAQNTQWEALRYAWTLSNLALRHTEATVVLARTDSVLQPAAWCTARAAAEATMWFFWLVEPEDVWEREARWLALLNTGISLGERPAMKESQYFAGRAAKIKEFRDAVEARLPAGVTVPGLPKISNLFTDRGDRFVRFYAIASQYTHATEFATVQWRKDLGTSATYGEFPEDALWGPPLSGAWSSFRATATWFINEHGGPPPTDLHLIDEKIAEAERAFVKATDSARGAAES